jgi:hypothetical protein
MPAASVISDRGLSAVVSREPDIVPPSPGHMVDVD